MDQNCTVRQACRRVRHSSWHSCTSGVCGAPNRAAANCHRAASLCCLPPLRSASKRTSNRCASGSMQVPLARQFNTWGFKLQLTALVGSKRCGCLLPRGDAAGCKLLRAEPWCGVCRLRSAGPWHAVVLALEKKCVRQALMSAIPHDVDWSSWASGTSVSCAALASRAAVVSCGLAASSAAVLSCAATSCGRARECIKCSHRAR